LITKKTHQQDKSKLEKMKDDLHVGSIH